MIKDLKQRQEGFTIIEVMIVLVIAAVILLIVFLAVPALQRNSRNTQRKNDIAGVLGGVTEYITNNNGSNPAVICGTGTRITIAGGTCASPTNAVTVNVSGQFTVAPTIAAYSAGQTATADQIKVYTAASCSNNALAAGSGRSIAALFLIETNTTQCVQS